MVQVTQVTLTPEEMFHAGISGLAIHVNAVCNGRKPVNGQPGWRSIGDNLDGAWAEAAVAKFSNVYWSGTWKNFTAVPDVGRVDVRYTRYDNGKLLLQQEDAADALYVLVTGVPPVFTIRGACLGRDGKRPEFWDATKPRPCFAVPQASLRVWQPINRHQQN